jgi:hypothetical protein
MSLDWEQCRAWLLPALEPEDGDEAGLVTDLISGRARLWPGERAALVTQCLNEHEGACLHVWLAGGDLSDILAMRPGIEAWARAQGCVAVTLDGRKGWTRALRGFGYVRHAHELKRML